MKKLFLLFLLYLLSLHSEAQDDISVLVQSMLSETPIEEDLQELCDQVGGRVTGSEANKKSVEWAYNKFLSIDVPVQKHAFEMPLLWLAKSTQAKVSGKNISFTPSVVSKFHSPIGKHAGKLISVKTGTKEDFENQAAAIKGNFVIVEVDLCLDIAGLFAEYSHAANVEILAKAHDAQGIVFMSSRPAGLLYRFITMKPTTNTLPQLIMSREEAKRCLRLLEENKSLDIEIDIDAQLGDSFTSHNVIAEIQGAEKPEEIIIIGAHLDSWAMGTGANDNGCNVSMLIDIARQMKKLEIQPKRTIRFALWNGEEQGYFGSWAYTLDHLNEMDKHKMAMSIDIGSGALTGFFTNGRPELPPVIDSLLMPVYGLGPFTQLDIPIVGTDNFDFMLQGVANLVGNHTPALYGYNYHASSDTYDKVNLKDLKRNSAVIAALIVGLANMDAEEITWERQTRDQIHTMFKKHDLEFTMRMFNVWEPWINGSRGIK